MALGILSIALHLAGLRVSSVVGLALGGAIWALLLAVVVTRLAEAPRRWMSEADTPAALTGVAATSVLGTSAAFFGGTVVATAALAIASLAWIVLVPAVIDHFRVPTVGVHFLLCVATESLAVLGAVPGLAVRAPWLGQLSLAPFVAGLVFYVLVVARFAWRELERGSGDHWMIVGALAISALAAGHLTQASARAPWPPWLHTGLFALMLVLIALTLAGYVVLVACELRWPRLRFDVRRWATAFPLGMTSAAALTAANVSGYDLLSIVGFVLIWPAVALSVVLLVASTRTLVASAAVGSPPAP